ncbi:metal-dependent hydrolase [Candidatus Woesearchaeota archaeon]|nr:metal-dependent hydrolase [Candidatus Woesearchaeota archaeon]
MFLTHLIGGIFSAVYFGSFLGISNDNNQRAVAIIVAAVFAMLPDIDMVKSKAGKSLQPFSTLISLLFRHRGFLHSFVFAAAVYFLVQYLFSATIAAAAFIGYSSHLLLDMATKEGIQPLSPFLKSKLKGIIRTGSFLEQLTLAAMTFLTLLKLA